LEVKDDLAAAARANAVLEAAKSVAEKLRTLAGATGDGSPLVDALSFPAASPRVRFNGLATEWERSEQTGIATLMKGRFSTFRNPAAHAPKVAWATSRSDALTCSLSHPCCTAAWTRRTSGRRCPDLPEDGIDLGW
jgi:uncharacterized protein (TIGR02391 family)